MQTKHDSCHSYKCENYTGLINKWVMLLAQALQVYDIVKLPRRYVNLKHTDNSLFF